MFPVYPYIVAEAGINHNGLPWLAQEMVYQAKSAGADAIKFQKYVTDEFTTPDDPLYDTFKKCELSLEVWRNLKKEADRVGIDFFATAQNPSDLEFLLTLDVPYVKIGSDDFSNIEMIRKMCKMTDKPFILSCGMATHRELHQVVNMVDPSPLAIMVCTSLYPTPLWSANINRVDILEQQLRIPVGFSDHTVGSLSAQLALSLGAVIFEKHFTLSHSFDGPDHSFSLTPPEFTRYVKDINDARIALGSGSFTIEDDIKNMREYVLGRRKKLAEKSRD